MLKFCPQCGKPLEKSVVRLITCNHCGFYYYLAPALANGLFLENEKGEVLLVKRRFEPFKNFWDSPGGFIDFDEDIEQSLRQEIREELGVEIKSLKYFGSYPDYYEYKNINYHSLVVVFTGTSVGNKFKASDDISDFKFFKKTELLAAKLAFTWLKKALQEYLSSSH